MQLQQLEASASGGTKPLGYKPRGYILGLEENLSVQASF